MQEDKNLKKILQEYAFEETSSTFANSVMQQINIGTTKQIKPLLNPFILSLLKIVFSLSTITLIICFLFLRTHKFHPVLFFNLNNEIYQQLFSFLIVFWIMMLVNTWWNSRQKKLQNFIN